MNKVARTWLTATVVLLLICLLAILLPFWIGSLRA